MQLTFSAKYSDLLITLLLFAEKIISFINYFSNFGCFKE